jgi:tRNA nucleotidyltransferase (CCA-adding enzyme)
LNLLHSIHPSLPWDTAIQTRLTSGLDTPPSDELGSVPNLSGLPFRRAFGYLLWLLSVPPHEIASIAKRLRFPVSLTKALQSASRLWADLPSLDCTRPSCWVARLEDLHPLALYAIYQSTEGPTCTAMHDYLVKWQHVHPTIDGNTLKEMGVPPGPVYQRVLGRLRDAWLDGEIETQTQEKELLARLLRDQQ